MKVVVSGFSTVTSKSILDLEEPAPFELSLNLKNKIILGETFEGLRPFLRDFRSNFSENDISHRRIMEALISVPKSRSTLLAQDCDIHLEKDADVLEKLTGYGYEAFHESLLLDPVAGSRREAVFEAFFKRFCLTATSGSLVDRYFGHNMSANHFLSSGAYWAVQRILDTKIPLLVISTAKDRCTFDLIKTRLQVLVDQGPGETEIIVNFGKVTHDRFMIFNFAGSLCAVSLGKGLEIFERSVFLEGCVLSSMNLTLANDMHQFSQDATVYSIKITREVEV